MPIVNNLLTETYGGWDNLPSRSGGGGSAAHAARRQASEMVTDLRWQHFRRHSLLLISATRLRQDGARGAAVRHFPGGPAWVAEPQASQTLQCGFRLPCSTGGLQHPRLRSC